jgi:hypothetical protein
MPRPGGAAGRGSIPPTRCHRSISHPARSQRSPRRSQHRVRRSSTHRVGRHSARPWPSSETSTPVRWLSGSTCLTTMGSNVPHRPRHLNMRSSRRGLSPSTTSTAMARVGPHGRPASLVPVGVVPAARCASHVSNRSDQPRRNTQGIRTRSKREHRYSLSSQMALDSRRY